MSTLLLWVSSLGHVYFLFDFIMGGLLSCRRNYDGCSISTEMGVLLVLAQVLKQSFVKTIDHFLGL
jgi:hypothetical protein